MHEDEALVEILKSGNVYIFLFFLTHHFTLIKVITLMDNKLRNSHSLQELLAAISYTFTLKVAVMFLSLTSFSKIISLKEHVFMLTYTYWTHANFSYSRHRKSSRSPKKPSLNKILEKLQWCTYVTCAKAHMKVTVRNMNLRENIWILQLFVKFWNELIPLVNFLSSLMWLHLIRSFNWFHRQYHIFSS